MVSTAYKSTDRASRRGYSRPLALQNEHQRPEAMCAIPSPSGELITHPTCCTRAWVWPRSTLSSSRADGLRHIQRALTCRLTHPTNAHACLANLPLAAWREPWREQYLLCSCQALFLRRLKVSLLTDEELFPTHARVHEHSPVLSKLRRDNIHVLLRRCQRNEGPLANPARNAVYPRPRCTSWLDAPSGALTWVALRRAKASATAARTMRRR